MKRFLRHHSKLHGAKYLIPNLFTTGNLFFGYFSIIKSIENQFFVAAGALLLSSIFDVLDGRIARLTRSTSAFGVQYDSLCDLVSFGVAPAILMYRFSLYPLGRMGWIICFIFMACGALRLARFNVQSSIGKTNGDFTGLPIPMPTGLIACFIAFLTEPQDSSNTELWLIQEVFEILSSEKLKLGFFLILAPLLSMMMVSNITYRSHKSIDIRIIKPFKLLAVLVFLFGLCAYKATLAGFVFFFCYALSGPVEWIFGKKPQDDDDIFQSSKKKSWRP